MSDEIVTARTEPPPPPPLRLCSTPGCDKLAVVAYRWEWGEEGMACAEHGATLQQTAANISRTVAVSALQPAGPVPLERSERIQLLATQMTLEAELSDTKARGLELYRENVALARNVQLLTLRDREAQAQLLDAGQRQAELQSKLDEVEGECAELAEEVGRLRTLAKFVDEETAPKPLGGGASPTGGGWPPSPNPNVVDG